MVPSSLCCYSWVMCSFIRSPVRVWLCCSYCSCWGGFQVILQMLQSMLLSRNIDSGDFAFVGFVHRDSWWDYCSLQSSVDSSPSMKASSSRSQLHSGILSYCASTSCLYCFVRWSESFEPLVGFCSLHLPEDSLSLSFFAVGLYCFARRSRLVSCLCFVQLQGRGSWTEQSHFRIHHDLVLSYIRWCSWICLVTFQMRWW